MTTFRTVRQFRHLCAAVSQQRMYGLHTMNADQFRRSYCNATRLWNWADHQDHSEEFWAILQGVCPWAFDRPDSPNSHRFAYHPSPKESAV